MLERAALLSDFCSLLSGFQHAFLQSVAAGCCCLACRRGAKAVAATKLRADSSDEEASSGDEGQAAAGPSKRPAAAAAAADDDPMSQVYWHGAQLDILLTGTWTLGLAGSSTGAGT